MGNGKDKKYRYKKRIFLNDDFESFAYVIAIVENSKHRNSSAKCEESEGGAKLIVESPYDKVSMNFELDLPDQVKESLTRIRALEALLKRFRKAFEKEAEARKRRSYEHIKDEIVTRR
jgi:hypothetical protein